MRILWRLFIFKKEVLSQSARRSSRSVRWWGGESNQSTADVGFIWLAAHPRPLIEVPSGIVILSVFALSLSLGGLRDLRSRQMPADIHFLDIKSQLEFKATVDVAELTMKDDSHTFQICFPLY